VTALGRAALARWGSVGFSGAPRGQWLAPQEAAVADQRHEFRVVVDGVDLPDEALARINLAVQKAVAAELAATDLVGDFRIKFPPHGPRPPWWGIWITPIDPIVLEKAGLETPEEFRGG